MLQTKTWQFSLHLNRMNDTEAIWFSKTLLKWHAANPRSLPWKNTKDPYHIWLSEVILQQTRVEQGLPYYKRFIEQYPSVSDLALAPEDEVLKLWEGLGYYSRARNLHATARFIHFELNGRFPETYQGILNLKGVGPYTASAIASFAFDLPKAVVDGNVFRVLSRIFGLETPIDTTTGKKAFQTLADKLLDAKQAGRYNQAIMNFGALLCRPRKPNCSICPFSKQCIALQTDRVEEFPVKSRKLQKRNRYFYYLVLRHQGQFILRKRTGKDVWQGLYEFPYLEFENALEEIPSLFRSEGFSILVLGDFHFKGLRGPYRQTLSHQRIHGYFLEFDLDSRSPLPNGSFQVSREQFSNYAFPRIIDWYLGDKSLTLNLL